MPKTFVPQSLIQSLVLALLFATLAACGGGGGGGKPPTPTPTPAPDTSPNDFSFEAVTGAQRGEVYTASVTVSGINTATPVSIEGGLFAIGETELVEEGQVTNGQSITVQVTASDQFSTEATATLTVGDKSADFTVTTVELDTTPEDFSFDAVPDAQRGETYTSNIVTIQGIDEQVAVSISDNGLYAIEDGGFINAPGDIEAGQTIRVRAVAAEALATSVNVELMVGTVTEVFTVTTIADTTPPTAEIYFPTPKTLTDASTVFVRGVASDDLSGVAGVTVNGTSATSTDGFATWQVASLPLIPGDETPLEVVVTDEAGNASEPEVMARVTQTDDLAGASFPDESVPFIELADIERGPDGGLFLANFDRSGGRIGSLYSLDPFTVEIQEISPNTEEQTFKPIVAIAFNDTKDSLYTVESSEAAPVTEVGLIDGIRIPVSDNTYDDTSIPMELIFDADLFDGNSTVPASLIVVADEIFSVDITTGIRSQLTGLDEGLGGVAVDDADGIAYIGSVSATNSELYALDLVTTETEPVLVASNDQPDSEVPLGYIRRISLINNGEAAIALASIPGGGEKIIQINLEEGENKGKKTMIVTFDNGIHEYCFSVNEERQVAYVCTDQRSISVVDLVAGSYHVVAKSAEPQTE